MTSTRHQSSALALIVCCVALGGLACGDDIATSDAAVADTGSTPRDSGQPLPDAGRPDAQSPRDASESPADAAPDSGTDADAGEEPADAAPADAATADATPEADAGQQPVDSGPVDSGPADSGPAADAGEEALDSGEAPPDSGSADSGSNAPTFTMVFDSIISQRCSCHWGVGAPEGLDMDTRALAYANLVNVPTVNFACNMLDRVEPGDAQNSTLFHKVEGINCGTQMPADGPPYLNPPDVALIEAWINAGALDD